MSEVEKRIADEQLHDRLQQLITTFDGVREDFDLDVIREAYAQKKYTECIFVIQNFIKIPFKLRVAYVNSGAKGRGHVWLETPVNLSTLVLHHGVEHVNKYCDITIWLRKPFLETALSIETFVYAIAHEMSHIILNAQEHPLRRSEPAVDLTAAIHGFSNILHIGRTQETYFFRDSRDIGRDTTTWGYLSTEQAFAAHLYISQLQVEQDVQRDVVKPRRETSAIIDMLKKVLRL